MKDKPLYIILILTPFVFSYAFGLDIYIPVLPEMTRIFNTTPSMVQLTMSLFLFTIGIGQLFIGPLSDRWGRKTIFYLASSFFALGSLGCAFAPTIGWLIALRVLSSIGACGMLVNSFAVVRDLYSHEESAKMYSYLNGAVGISPTFAPILGGYLACNYGWRSIFFFLAGAGSVSLLIALFFIKETRKSSIKQTSIIKNYQNVFFHRQFITYALLAGLAESIFFCFFSISPFILIEVHQIPADSFGYYFAAFGAVLSLGGFASGRLIVKWGIHKTIASGIAFILVGGAAMFLCHYLMPHSLEGFLIPTVIACLGAMFLLGGSASLALEPFAAFAGTASAAFGFIEFGLSSIVGSLLLLFPTHNTLPYGIFILILGTLSLSLFYFKRTCASK